MTRAEARAGGFKHYEGPPCKFGHSPPVRYVTDGSCVICKKFSADKWHKDNPLKAAASRAAWRSRNAETVALWHKTWVQANRERAREIDAAYRARNWLRRRKCGLTAEAKYRLLNRDKIRAKGNARRSAKLGCRDSHTASDIKFLMTFQGGKCAMCRSSIKRKRHIDHIIPLSKGGSDGLKNIQLLCVSCNLKKGDRHPIVFARSRGMLL